jgi:hypothetical protein
MAETTYTHDDLVARAERWLRYSARMPADYTLANGRRPMQRCCCRVVLTEPVSGSEQPDAIGWFNRGYSSFIIECKVSHKDFQADRRKRFRNRFRREGAQRTGLGQYRYFMAPRGLIAVDELPDGWGLLEVKGPRVYIKRHSQRYEYNVGREMAILWSECRKIQFVDQGGELLPTRAGRRITRAMKLMED